MQEKCESSQADQKEKRTCTCSYCGKTSEDEYSLCDPQFRDQRYGCGICGRSSVVPDRLCRPRML